MALTLPLGLASLKKALGAQPCATRQKEERRPRFMGANLFPGCAVKGAIQRRRHILEAQGGQLRSSRDDLSIGREVLGHARVLRQRHKAGEAGLLGMGPAAFIREGQLHRGHLPGEQAAVPRRTMGVWRLLRRAPKWLNSPYKMERSLCPNLKVRGRDAKLFGATRDDLGEQRWVFLVRGRS